MTNLAPSFDPSTDFQKYTRFACAVAKGLLGTEDAEDVAQETCLEALAKKPAEREGGRFGWFAVVAKHKSVDRRRGDRRRAAREEAVARLRPEADRSFVDTAEREETTRALFAALGTLDEPSRVAFHWRFADGLSAVEIADKLRSTPEAVRQRLSRARARLRAELEARYGSRTAWITALTPLADSIGPYAVTATAATAAKSAIASTAASLLVWGGLLMSKKWSAAASVLILSALAALVWPAQGEEPPTTPGLSLADAEQDPPKPPRPPANQNDPPKPIPSVPFTEPPPESPLIAESQPAAAAALVVRALNGAGVPIANATVLLTRGPRYGGPNNTGESCLMVAEPAQPFAVSRTAENGLAQFHGLPAARYQLTVAADGYAPTITDSFHIYSSREETKAITLHAGRTREGKVVDDVTGLPVKSAKVAAVISNRNSDENDIGEAEPALIWHDTNADGSFRLQCDTGNTEIRVAAAGRANVCVDTNTYSNQEPIEIRLPSPSTIEGVVHRHEDMIPLQGIQLLFWSLGGHRRSAAATRTDALGRFSLPFAPTGDTCAVVIDPNLRLAALPSNIDSIWPIGGGHCDNLIPLGEVLPGETRRFSIALTSGSSLQGTTVDADTGRGVAGCIVTLRSAEYCPWNPYTAITTADEHGRFRFDAIAASRVCVLAQKEGWFQPPTSDTDAQVDGTEIDLSCNGASCPNLGASDNVLQNITVNLRRGHSASGVLADQSGRPIAGVRLLCRAFEDPTWPDHYRFEARSTSDAQGRFAFAGIPPTSCVLSAEHDCFTRLTPRVLDMPPANVELIRLTMEPSAALHVVALFDDGTPASGVDLTFEPIEWTGTAAAPDQTRTYEARTTRDGHAVFEGLPIGQGDIRTRSPKQWTLVDARADAGELPGQMTGYVVAGADRRVVVRPEAGTPVVLRIVPGGVIRGAVRDALGSPVSGARVHATSAHGGRVDQHYADTDDRGVFCLGALLDDEYDLEVSGPVAVPTLMHQSGSGSSHTRRATAVLKAVRVGLHSLQVIIE